MNYKRLITFILFAFLPMVGVGLFLHVNGGATEQTTTGRLTH